MDISTLSLPPRSQRGSASTLFGVKPAFSSVNVSYETAESHNSPGSSRDPFDEQPDQDDAHSHSGESRLSESNSVESNSGGSHSGNSHRDESPADESNADDANADPNASEASFSTKSLPQKIPEVSSLFLHPDDSANASSINEASSFDSHHAFPSAKPIPDSPSQTSLHVGGSTPSKSSRRRARARSSISIASAECQSFINSLKEPKYAKPLSADEISWIFQDFYRKLRQDVLGSEDELLTQDELEKRKDLEANIDSILDRAERAVTCGDLHTKLFGLSSQHDFNLQMKLDSIRNFPVLLNKLEEQLGINEEQMSAVDVGQASQIMSRISKETSPKGKVMAIVKTMQFLGDSLAGGSADTMLPLFVLTVVESSANDLWQNFTYIQRFRRGEALTGQAEYCLTSFEATIHILEEFTATDIPVDVSDPLLFTKPLKNPRTVNRQRSTSQSSVKSNSPSAFAPASLGQRLGETLNQYKTMLVTSSSNSASHIPPTRGSHSRKLSTTGNPIIDQRFVHADAESLTIGEVRTLLREYNRLADYIERRL